MINFDFHPYQLDNKNLRRQFIHSPQAGDITLYEAACLCNRCGACSSVCPVYRALGGEIFAPRGQNQLMRLILERKINTRKNKAEILRTAESCSSCGQCSSVCPVKNPIYKFTYELKEALSPQKSNALRALSKIPSLVLFAKRAKLPKHLQTGQVKAVYMPSQQGLSFAANSFEIMNKTVGEAKTIKSGLFLTQAYFSGDTILFKKILNAVKKDYLAATKNQANIPLITDNIEDYRLLKQATEFGKEFEILSKQTHFITDFIEPKKITVAALKNKVLALQENNVLFYGDDMSAKSHKLLNCIKGIIFVEFNQHKTHALAALNGAKGLSQKDKKEIKQRLASKAAENKVELMVVLSGGEKVLLNKIFKHFYPQAKALHISELLNSFFADTYDKK
ncbi:MAG: 4Fe-4S dicluster domain-containing protein [Elusimicrobiota bacterium]|jgi:Fe-S oxidoreductase|nr:4Fe-4S dicluster domain-containing protein [Elusimicrobiota bacterium]